MNVFRIPWTFQLPINLFVGASFALIMFSSVNIYPIRYTYRRLQFNSIVEMGRSGRVVSIFISAVQGLSNLGKTSLSVHALTLRNALQHLIGLLFKFVLPVVVNQWPRFTFTLAFKSHNICMCIWNDVMTHKMIKFLILLITVAFMVSASFHAGCRQGSLTVPKKRGTEIRDENPGPIGPSMTLSQLTFRWVQPIRSKFRWTCHGS